MRCVNYMLVVILSSMVILGTMGHSERGLNVEDLDGFQEPLQVLVENSNKRLLKRQTDCPPPYHVATDDGRCVWSCGVGTTPGTATNECVCQNGYYQTGTDQFGRRVCEICPQPYHVVSSDGRCVWSCAAGTEPDDTTNECVCQDGYYQTGTDQFGRRVCEICPQPYHVVSSDGRCVWSCGVGTTPDDTTNECVCQDGYYQTGTDQFGRRVCEICPKPYHVLTKNGRCVWSCGEGTRPDLTSNECVCQRGYYQTGTDQFGRRVCKICPKPYHVVSSDGRCVWSCAAGTTPDSTTNECVCQDGYYQTGTDIFGRIVCQICPKPYHVVSSDGRCVWSCGEGTTPSTTTNECVCQRGFIQTGTDQWGRRVCKSRLTIGGK